MAQTDELIKVGTRIPKRLHSAVSKQAEKARTTVGALVYRGVELVVEEMKNGDTTRIGPDKRRKE